MGVGQIDFAGAVEPAPGALTRRVRVLVWGAWLLVAVSVVAQLANTSAPLHGADIVDVVLISITSTVVGGAIAARVPENTFGWILLAIGTTGAVAASAASLPEPGVVRWLGYWLWWPAYALAPVALFVFPTGHLPSRRWRPVVAATIAA